MNRDSPSVMDWIRLSRDRYPLHYRKIKFEDCQLWKLNNGRIQHHTGGFFSVVGLRSHFQKLNGSTFEQPMIDQPEIGVLGFVVRQSENGWDWLLHAKTEPGNTNGTQIGPTVQATKSNYMQLHGGKPTEMLELFLTSNQAIHVFVDIEQSEQGDRFLGKYNRNMVIEVPFNFKQPSTELYKWFSGKSLKESLLENFTINTDSRSVIFCSDWSTLLEEGETEPFVRWHQKGSFGEQLLRSWQNKKSATEVSELIDILNLARSKNIQEYEVVGIDNLSEWYLDGWSLKSISKVRDPLLEFYEVNASGREVEIWCQPMMANKSAGQIILLCSQIDNCLKFWLRLGHEPGFKEGIQWSPSFVTGECHQNVPMVESILEHEHLIVHAQVSQSDEGGRFMNSVAVYQVIEISSTAASLLDATGADGAWVSLAGLKQLAAYKGMLSNELRSVASLLISWC